MIFIFIMGFILRAADHLVLTTLMEGDRYSMPTKLYYTGTDKTPAIYDDYPHRSQERGGLAKLFVLCLRLHGNLGNKIQRRERLFLSREVGSD